MRTYRPCGAVTAFALVLSLVSGFCHISAFGQDEVVDPSSALERSAPVEDRGPFFDQSALFPPEEAGSAIGSYGDDDGKPAPVVDFLESLIALAIVLAGICLLVWVLKRFVVRTPVLLDKRVGRVVGRIYLSPKNVVYLVRLADRVLVIGASTTTLTCLSEITDPAVVEEIAAGSGAFSDTLDLASRSISEEDTSVPPPTTIDGHMEDIESQISRLRTLGDHESETK